MSVFILPSSIFTFLISEVLKQIVVIWVLYFKDLTEKLATLSKEKLALEESIKTLEEKLNKAEENLTVRMTFRVLFQHSWMISFIDFLLLKDLKSQLAALSDENISLESHAKKLRTELESAEEIQKVGRVSH